MSTMKDVAKKAGVSTATVSYVLNEKREKVSAEVFERVMQVSQELDYHPNMMAKALRMKKSKIIGVLSEDITTYQVNNIMKGINQKADSLGYQIIQSDLSLSDKIYHDNIQDYTRVYDYQEEIQKKLRILKSAGAGSIIYVGMHDRDITGLLTTDMPIIYAYCYTKNVADITVYSDNQNISREAVTKLIEKGHRRIGLIGGPMDSIPSYKRMMGYQEALMLAGIRLDPELMVYGNWSVFSGRKECAKLMELESPPTAIFSMNDWMAVGAMEVLKEKGCQIGKDIDIFGFDNIEFCEFLNPPLTSIQVPLEEIGNQAALKAINLAEETVVPPSTGALPCTLIERESCRM